MRIILLILSSALFLSGCVTADPDAPVHRKISARLDQEAMEYGVITARAWQNASARMEDAFRQAMKNGDPRKNPRRQLLLQNYFTLQMAVALSGVQNSPGCGYSAKVVDDLYIHNRFFLASAPELPLFPDKFFGKELINTAEFLNRLPAGTRLAAAADIRPETLLDTIAQTGDYVNHAASIIPAGIPLRELAQASAGVWKITVLGGKMPLIKVEIPDNNGKLFNFCSLIGRSNAGKPGFKTTFMRVTFPGLGEIIKEKDRIIIYSSPAAEKRFIESPPRLSDPRFAAMTSGIPETVPAVFFTDLRDTPPETYPLAGENFPFPARPEIPELLTLSSTGDGWLCIFNSDTTFLTRLTGAFLPLASKLARQKPAGKSNENAAENKETEDKKTGKTANVKETSAGKTVNCLCRKNLDAALKYLADHPDITAGFYQINDAGELKPAAPGKKVQDCLLAYFGSRNSQLPVPVWITFPHEKSFLAAFSDGKIQAFQLEKPDSFRRIISFLRTRINYDEKIFRQLIEQADILDRIQKECEQYERKK